MEQLVAYPCSLLARMRPTSGVWRLQHGLSSDPLVLLSLIVPSLYSPGLAVGTHSTSHEPTAW